MYYNVPPATKSVELIRFPDQSEVFWWCECDSLQAAWDAVIAEGAERVA